MNIDIIKDEQLYKEYSVSCDAKEIIKSTDQEIAERAKNFKLAGFREGKVPLSLVKRQIGQEVLSKQINHKVGEILQKIATDNKLNYSGAPNIEIEDFQPEGSLKFIAKINLLPQIPTINLNDPNLAIEKLELKITDDDMKEAQKAVMNATKSFKKVEDLQYQAQKGDALVIDFLGKIAGEEFEGNKANSIQITIGSGQFIAEFEDKLIGMKKNLEQTIDVKFPDDYHNKDIAGKNADFTIKVHDILVPENSEQDFNDDFAKKVGLKDLNELNDMLQKRMNDDFAAIARLRTKKILFDKIDKVYDFSVPEAMLQADYEVMWSEVKDKNHDKPEEEIKAELKKIAHRRVKLGLILADLAKNHQITLNEDDITKAKENEKNRAPDKAKEIEEFFQKKENIDRIRGALLEEKVVDYLMSKILSTVITVTPKEFNEKYAKDIKDQ